MVVGLLQFLTPLGNDPLITLRDPKGWDGSEDGLIKADSKREWDR